MERIQFDDLAAVENLTAEQMEQIYGAGWRSFKPTFEALEDRQLMAAGLGQSLLPDLAPPKGPVENFAPRLRGGARAVENAASVVDQKDADSLQTQTRDLFTQKILSGLHNPWGFKQIKNLNNSFAGNEVQVRLLVSYANIGGAGTAILQWNYNFVKSDGGSNVFKLASTSHSSYKGWAENGIDGIDARMRLLPPSQIENGDYVYWLRVNRTDGGGYAFDMRKAAEELSQTIGQRFNDGSVNGRHLMGNGKIESVTGQGFTLKFRVQSNWMQWRADPGVESQVEAEISLTFKYDRAVFGFERFTCTDAKGGIASVASRDRYNHNARWDHPGFDLGTLGLNEGGLKSDYQAVLTMGDGRTLEKTVGAVVHQKLGDLKIHGTIDGCGLDAAGRPMWGKTEKIPGGYRVTFRVEIDAKYPDGSWFGVNGPGSYDFQMVVKANGDVECTGAGHMEKEYISAADAAAFQKNLADEVKTQLRG
jgi:hypothetical protein